ncbi:MAG: C25 family cysteine peptidase [Candidatus Eisenbacteria bacterium]|nr:C25 family cysteine peptidase [Candidatus Eisenbacteria bacterium]
MDAIQRKISILARISFLFWFLAFAYSPTKCGAALTDPTRGATYLIIAYDAFLDPPSTLSPLVWLRQQKGQQVEQVKISEVVDEFGSGDRGLRDFLRYAYWNWSPRPQYVFLVGDVSDTVSAQVPTHRFAPYFSYGGKAIWDDWLVCVDDTTDVIPDMALGRLPASTREQVTAYVSKVFNYELDCASAPWKKRVLFLGNDTSGTHTVNDAILVRNQVAEALGIVNGFAYGPWQRTTLIHSDCGFDDPFGFYCHTSAMELFNQGQSIVCAIGVMSSERSLEQFIRSGYLGPSDPQNTQMPSIVLGMSCHLARFDVDSIFVDRGGELVKDVILADRFLFPQTAGAVAWFGATGATQLHANGWLLNEVLSRIVRSYDVPLGRVFLDAKKAAFENYPWEEDVFKEYVLLGDPALISPRYYPPNVSNPQKYEPCDMEASKSYRFCGAWYEKNCGDGVNVFWTASRGTIVPAGNNWCTEEGAWQAVTAVYTAPPAEQFQDIDELRGLPVSITCTVRDQTGLSGSASSSFTVWKKLDWPQPYDLPLLEAPRKPTVSSEEDATHFRYSVKHDAGDSEGGVKVELSIYDIRGRLVDLITREREGPGSHEILWKGIDRKGRRSPNGVLFYHLRIGETAETGKFLLMR